MATYAIGDIQGCFDTLEALLGKLNLNVTDEIWLVGDLVNRGPKSLEVLRWACEEKRVRAVLGNHDVWLLACANGAVPRPKDTLSDVLNAPDSEKLVQWLSKQPLLRIRGKDVLVHAGLHPQWDIKYAKMVAENISRQLQSPVFLSRLAKRERLAWNETLPEEEKLIAALGVFTRIRVCNDEGKVDFDFTGELADVPKHYFPWFGVPQANWKSHRVIFGHWAALGLHHTDHVDALDSGCVWGRSLSALCLESGKIISQDNCEKDE